MRTDVAAWEDPRRVLGRHGFAPKRGFSQNFLVSQHAVEAIANAVGPAANERVIELGPGAGTLSVELVRREARVTAIEKDRDMLTVLRAELGAYETFTVLEGDAADVNYADYAREENQPVAVAGNLPYAITGSILRNFTEQPQSISRAVIMVQREVRDRLLAHPDTREYGALSIFVANVFDVTPVLLVPAGAFFPPPKVQSAVVKLTRRKTPRVLDDAIFTRIVRAAFDTRRKTLRNALVRITSSQAAAELLEAAHIDGQRRGETLSIEEFGALAEKLRERPELLAT